MDSVVCGMRFILRFIVRPPASLSLGGERRRSKILMKTRKNPSNHCDSKGFGACGRIRTGDLLITSELLCQLSHTSINADGSIAYFAGAVNRFSGEESLFLLRLLPKWVRTGNDNT